MPQVLVVANRTVGGDELADVIRARHAAGPCEFHLLVPVPPTPPIGVAMGFSAMEVGMIPAAQGPDEQEIAQERLQFGLGWMRDLGVTVSGAVGEADAVRAIPRCSRDVTSTRSSSPRCPRACSVGCTRTSRTVSSASSSCR